MTDSGKVGGNDLLDFDNLFRDFPDDLHSFFGDVGETPNSAASLSMGEIEKLSMNEYFEPPAAKDADAFLSELLVDSPPRVDAVSDSSASNARDCSPSESEEKGHHSPSDSEQKGHHLPQQEEQNHVDNNDAVDDDDPIAKKRKRQLRNRDAAVRSRERKKMYVRDLELKSRYYEAECRRLQWMLQCVQAENYALQFSLHGNHQAFGTPTTKQESAVLLLESLLLGSLLWLMGIIGLFILPKQLLSILDAALLENLEGKNQRGLAPRKVRSNMFGTPGVFESFMKSKRWRGSRTRMKVLSERSCKCLMSVSLPLVLCGFKGMNK